MILTAGMAHQRKLIRQAVVALLVAASTVAADRVVGTRVLAHKRLPAISVYTLSDLVNDDASSEVEEAHELELEIACWVSHSEANPVDDAMDDIAEEVEAAMRANPYITVTDDEDVEVNLATDVTFTGTVMEVAEDDGRSDPMIGIAVLSFTVKYHAALEPA